LRNAAYPLRGIVHLFAERQKYKPIENPIAPLARGK
jgi:hypothetical protein